MINLKTKNNKGFARLLPNYREGGQARHNMRSILGGFTLVETMFAVFILTSTIVGLMTVVSRSLFAARYARDEITANYLLQEAVDYIRNDRDSTVFFKVGGTWDDFLNKYKVPCSPSVGGCTIDVLAGTDPKSCNSSCPYLYFDKDADTTSFYVTDDYVNSGKTKTNFRRKIIVERNDTILDEIDVTVTIDWINGGSPVSRSLKTSLMKWE